MLYDSTLDRRRHTKLSPSHYRRLRKIGYRIDPNNPIRAGIEYVVANPCSKIPPPTGHGEPLPPISIHPILTPEIHRTIDEGAHRFGSDHAFLESCF